ncbi:MAG: hypothetical protein JOZ41_19255 [Chloroflexi bacterium]|nr:hypothetical protein [Chloroflexota bacterium]
MKVPSPVDDQATTDLKAITAASEPTATVWVSRITSAIGGVCLIIALTLWLLRPDHYRPVLALLTIAMFAAILHSYTFENGGRG